MESMHILQQEIDKEKNMAKRRKRRKSKVITIINVMLLGVIVLFLAGNICLHQALLKTQNSKTELQKEKEELESQAAELEVSKKEFQKQLEEKKAEPKQTADLETEEQSDREDGENQAEPKTIDGMKELISSKIADRTGAGENWQVYVQRLSDDAAESMGEGKMVAASLIKLYIMGAVYADYDNLISANGKAKVDGLLHSMITVSDNDAANTLTRMLGKGDKEAGKAAVNAYCSENGYPDSSMGRMLLETNTDRENYTSAKDCGRFLERVYKKETEHAEDMLALLKQQERTGKIPAGVPSGVETANKTGELANVENDAAIVFAGEQPYILCVLSEQLKNPGGARETIVQLSSAVYNQISK